MTTKKTVQRIGIILAISIAVLLTGVWLVGTVNAQSPGGNIGRGMGAMMGGNMMGYRMGATSAFTGTPPYGYRGNPESDDDWGMGHGMMGRGMMGRFGMAGNTMDCPMDTSTAITDTLPYGARRNSEFGETWGMGRGMMGGARRGATTAEPTVANVDDARTLAQAYVTTNVSGVTLGDSIAPRPGGYRFAVVRDGKVVGVVGVNAYSGEVWYDAWE